MPYTLAKQSNDSTHYPHGAKRLIIRKKERAVLAFAEAVTLLPNSDVSDEVFNELAKFYSTPEIADLTLAVAMINTWNRVNKTFRTIPGNYKVGMFG